MKVVILRFDDAKSPRHYDTLGHHQIVIFIKVISDARPLLHIGLAMPKSRQLILRGTDVWGSFFLAKYVVP